MRPIDYADHYAGIRFVVNINSEMVIETEIKYLSCQSAILRILSPDEYHDCRISTPHVPSFAYPTIMRQKANENITIKSNS